MIQIITHEGKLISVIKDGENIYAGDPDDYTIIERGDVGAQAESEPKK